MKKFKTPLLFFLLCLASAFSFAFQDLLFGHRENVTSLVRKNKPIEFTKRLFFSTQCELSLSGWSKDSQDSSANEHLKIVEIKSFLRSSSGNEDVPISKEHLGRLYFDIKKAGEFVVKIKKYQQPLIEEVDSVYVSLFCKSSIQVALLIISCLLVLVGAIGFIVATIVTIFKTFKEKK